MTGQLDINSLSAWATIVVTVATAGGVVLRLARWRDSIDLKMQEQHEDFKEFKHDVATELAALRAELKPNGGGSHHDRVLTEIRELRDEVAPRRRRKRVY